MLSMTFAACGNKTAQNVKSTDSTTDSTLVDSTAADSANVVDSVAAAH